MGLSLGPAVATHGGETIQQVFEWYYELGEILDRDDYVQSMGERARYLREWSLFLDEYPLLVTPFLMRPLYNWNDDAQSFEVLKDIFDSSMYSCGTNYLGLPAGVFGVDLVEGLPAAVQIVGEALSRGPGRRCDGSCAGNATASSPIGSGRGTNHRLTLPGASPTAPQKIGKTSRGERSARASAANTPQTPWRSTPMPMQMSTTSAGPRGSISG